MIELINEWITNFGNWYYAMIFISVIIGLCASYIHNNGIPLIFTILLGVILHYGIEYLKPMLLNYTAYESYTMLGYMLTTMSILWVMIYSLIHFNLIMYGEVSK